MFASVSGGNTTYGIYVKDSTSTTAQAFGMVLEANSTGPGTQYGIYNNMSVDGTGGRYGFYNYVQQNSSSASVFYGTYQILYPGGSGTKYGSATNVFATNNPTGLLYGTYSNVNVPTAHATSVYSVYAQISSAGTSGTHFGVYSNPGTGGSAQWAFYGIGNSFLSGGTWQTSDEKLKTNIQPINNALSIVGALTPATYEYRTEAYPELGLSEGRKYGLLANNVQQVMPEMVLDVSQPILDTAGNPTGNSVDFKAVNYDMMIPVLVKAIQEQQAQIEDLKLQIELLRAEQSEVPVPNLNDNNSNTQPIENKD